MSEQKNIEYAKSYFVLAQLLIILAGFLFASSGVAWSNSQSGSLGDSSNLIEAYKMLEDYSIKNNITLDYKPTDFLNDYIDIVKNKINLASANGNLSTIYMVSGLFLSFLSFVFWAYGKHKLR